uniref:Uncharacterized protein n=1 Tax=Photinus pyralis TaxID=7054 RepID=A0A1Y1MHQ2_PHOPY
MSDSGVQFFEGVEKLLEIWFTNGRDSNKHSDLRKIPRGKLESILKIVHCEIISFVNNDQIDAYVLSESSMFISKRRFILKTCGTTTPLMCLQPLLLLVEQYAGFTEVEDLFYSRKNYKRPELQVQPHQDFDQEVNDRPLFGQFPCQITPPSFSLVKSGDFIYYYYYLISYFTCRWRF